MKRHALAAALAIGSVAVGLAAADTGGAAAVRNTRHALIIGIGQYSVADVPALAGVPHDMDSARQMARSMSVPDSHVTVLRDHEATAARIRAEIAALGTRLQPGDRVFVYYSGHGTRWYDARTRTDGCTEGLLASDGEVLTNVEMGQRLAPLARVSDKMLVFYDACFSGGVADAPMRTRSLRIGGVAVTPKFSGTGAPEQCARPSNFRSRALTGEMQQARALPQNVVHVAASRSDEVSFDSSAVGGFATSAWRDCLLGQARDLDGSGAITVDEVTQCAQARVTGALAGHAGITGQQMTVSGNRSFVPAWMGASFAPPAAGAASSAPATTPAGAASAAAPAPPATTPASTPALGPTPVATPAQLLAELHAQRDGNRRVLAVARNPRLAIGKDKVEFEVESTRDGYLYIALAGSDGQSLYLIYPNDLASDNRLTGGRRVSLPGAGWELVAAGPPGPETLLVMVTEAPRDLSTLGREKAGPFMKTLLDAQGRARLQAVLANGTPSSGCGAGTAPSCSDAFGSALLRLQTVP